MTEYQRRKPFQPNRGQNRTVFTSPVSARIQVPKDANEVRVTNTTNNVAFIRFGDSSVEASSSDTVIAANSSIRLSKSTLFDYMAYFNLSGGSALLQVQFSGGSGVGYDDNDLLTGLAAWLDASDTTTITESSNAVSQWNDKSANGYHFTQGIGANQPLTNTNTKNGQNVITFDGTDDFLENSSIASIFSGTDKILTVFCVYKASPTVTSFQSPFGGRDTGNNTRVAYAMRGTNFNKQIFWQRVNDAATTNNIDTGQDNDGLFNLVSIKQTGTDVVINYNKTQIIDQSDTYGATTVDNFGIGATVGGGSLNRMTGDVAEFIVYDRALSTSEINQVNDYLYTKWALFAPPDITSNTVWLESTNNEQIIQSGGSVSQWRDRSGNDNHFDQGTGAVQPDTGITTQNGLNVIDFTRGDFMESTYLVPEGDFSIFIVVKSETSGSFDFFFTQGNVDVDWAFLKQSTDYYYISLNGGSIGSSSGIQAPNDIIMNLTNDRVGSTNNFTLYKNGTSSGTNSSDYANAGTKMSIGAKDDGGPGRFDGWIAEVVIYEKLLSDSERNTVENYLNEKWAIY